MTTIFDPFEGTSRHVPDPFVEEPSDLDIEIEELDFWDDDDEEEDDLAGDGSYDDSEC